MFNHSVAMAQPSRRVLVAALLLALSPLAVTAHDANDDADKQPNHPKNLDRVIVLASPVQPLTFETDPKLPRQPVPASDGADFLKTIPGFSALRNGGTNGDPVLRGMFGSRLNLLTNDGAMPGACPSRMDNPLSYVAPETFDALIVVKGPQTVLWGPGASAGTVRFQRDLPHFDSTELQIQGSALSGSFARNDQVLDMLAGAEKGYVRVSANRSESGDYEDGQQQRVASAWKKWNADASLGWTPDADTALELTVGTGDAQARYAGRGMDGSQFRRNSLGLRFEKTLHGTLQKISANAYRNEADHVMDNYSLRTTNPMGAMPMPMASNVMRTTKGGRAAAEWQWAAFSLVAGVDTQHSVHRRRNAPGVGAYLQRPWLHDATFRNAGVFSEGTWQWQDGKSLITGVRMDRAEVSDYRPTLGMMGMTNPTFGQRRSETLPAGFVRYEHELTALGVGWYAGLGHTQRMPDYWELFSPDRGPMGSANAFAGVLPEKTTQLDVGAHWRGQRSSAWVSAYAGRIEDFILFRYMTGSMMSRTSMASNVDARIHGAEAGAEFRPNAQWAFGGSVAWAWGANTTQHTALPQMTPLEGRLTFAWEKGRWNAGGLLRGVAAQTRVALNQGNVVGRDLGSSAGFAMLSLNAGHRLSERLQLTAGVDNVLDRVYSEHLNLAGNADFGYPADPLRINEPGRSVWVKLNFSP